MAELKHGFTTREEWQSFFNTYFERIDEINDLVFAITKGASDFEYWLESYKKQSVVIHELYTRNSLYLDRHITYFLEHGNAWEKETAEPLLSYMFRYCTRFQDVEAAYKVTQSLYAYNKKQGNEIEQMKCLLVLVTCYGSLDLVHYREKTLLLCDKGIRLYEKHYSQLTQEEKSMGLSLYDFESIAMYEFMDPCMDITHTFDEVLYPAFERRMKAIDIFLKEADQEEECNAILPYMRKCWINTFSSVIAKLHKGYLAHDRIKKLYHIAFQQYEEEKNIATTAGNVINEAIVMMCDYHLYKIDDDMMYQYLEEKINRIPNKAISSPEEFDEETLNALCLFSRMIDVLDVNHKKKMHMSKELLERISRFCSLRQKYTYFEHSIDLNIYCYVIRLLKYCENEKETFLQLLNFTVLRQMQTAIHTIMVSRLASVMISAMIDQIPEHLAESLSCDISTIRKHRRDVIGFVEKAALLHDVGKILCSTVINMQYRKLIDIEFETIKFHPVTSKEILSSIPKLTCYCDIAEGHHKSYDGTFGYPDTCDNVHSPQKILIDMITICDAMDAATDTYGRNYTVPKELDKVMQEFIKEKGTRYSPLMVDLLVSDDNLLNTLKDILEKGRKETYHFVYDLLYHRNVSVTGDEYDFKTEMT